MSYKNVIFCRFHSHFVGWLCSNSLSWQWHRKSYFYWDAQNVSNFAYSIVIDICKIDCGATCGTSGWTKQVVIWLQHHRHHHRSCIYIGLWIEHFISNSINISFLWIQKSTKFNKNVFRCFFPLFHSRKFFFYYFDMRSRICAITCVYQCRMSQRRCNASQYEKT